MVTIIAFITKSMFKQPRPAKFFQSLNRLDEVNLIAGVDVYYGFNSFPSGHTMSAFAISTFLMLCFPQKWGLSLLLFALAALTALSRMYLGHHFLQDVYLGALLGVLLGGAMYLGMIKYSQRQKNA
ncbi:MAG: phosphatase PAP2 family protein [Saprospiraceae bacterium]|nr:phosphatase PAP2 family protein [Saprospiraceae bacterium]